MRYILWKISLPSNIIGKGGIRAPNPIILWILIVWVGVGCDSEPKKVQSYGKMGWPSFTDQYIRQLVISIGDRQVQPGSSSKHKKKLRKCPGPLPPFNDLSILFVCSKLSQIQLRVIIALSTRVVNSFLRYTLNQVTNWSRCSFSMMVKWANDGLLKANATKMLVNDVEMLINDGEMSIWSYTHYTIID